ncbi:MAG: AAA family ATPase [Acidobacteriota bacterium]|jgi:dCMP deaminase|nr:AAA family ATPase [Acidobacteriota bacterium]
MIIGLTGKNGAGKTEVCDYLRARGFEYVSLSDAIRAEIRRRGEEVTRETLIKTGTEMREKGGAGILAERVMAGLESEHNYVIDSIRNPAEVEALRRRPDFRLFAIEALAKTRFERSLERARENTAATFEQFMAEEERELHSENPAAQQLIATMALADNVIENNGTIEVLYARLDEILPLLMSLFARPGWDEYFMNIAKVVATRSNCMKRKVAAIIVKDRRVISTGYNGTPRGARNCNEGGCPRCNGMAASGTALDECLCSHGEENAITQAAYHGISLKGSTLYTTFAPCLQCTKLIINSGIVEVVYNKDYTLNARALSLLAECGVALRQFTIHESSC